MDPERTDLSRGAKDEVIFTDIRRRREKITRIVNIYNQSDTQSGERLAQKLNWQRVIRQGGTVLVGNFPTHNIWWDLRCRVQRNDTFWEDVVDENGLEVGNYAQPTHYWTREDHKGESVIDLTLAYRPITKRFILADDHATGSDNNVIKWEVEADRQEEADHGRVVGWNLAEMTEENTEAAEKLWAELAKGRAYLDAECTEDGVEQKAAWCDKAVSSILNAMAKKIRICAKSKRWWNADIKDRRKVVRREKGRRENPEDAARAKAELQKSIRQSNSQMWSH